MDVTWLLSVVIATCMSTEAGVITARVGKLEYKTIVHIQMCRICTNEMLMNEPNLIVKECHEKNRNDSTHPWCSVGDLPTCSPIPDIKNGKIVFENDNFRNVVYTWIAIECDFGFISSSNKRMQCHDDYLWSEEIPKCTRNTCSKLHLDALANMTYTISQNSIIEFGIGSSINFTCNHGYYTHDTTTMVCLENRTWSSHIPRCQKEMEKKSSSNVLIIVLCVFICLVVFGIIVWCYCSWNKTKKEKEYIVVPIEENIAEPPEEYIAEPVEDYIAVLIEELIAKCFESDSHADPHSVVLIKEMNVPNGIEDKYPDSSLPDFNPEDDLNHEKIVQDLHLENKDHFPGEVNEQQSSLTLEMESYHVDSLCKELMKGGTSTPLSADTGIGILNGSVTTGPFVVTGERGKSGRGLMSSPFGEKEKELLNDSVTKVSSPHQGPTGSSRVDHQRDVDIDPKAIPFWDDDDSCIEERLNCPLPDSRDTRIEQENFCQLLINDAMENPKFKYFFSELAFRTNSIKTHSRDKSMYGLAVRFELLTKVQADHIWEACANEKNAEDTAAFYVLKLMGQNALKIGCLTKYFSEKCNLRCDVIRLIYHFHNIDRCQYCSHFFKKLGLSKEDSCIS